MILDHLSNSSLYQFSNPLLTRGLEFLHSPQIATLPLGRTEIEGEKFFAIVQEYSTKPESECFWEAHRKYIDIQYLVAGHERIDHAPISQLREIEPYDEKNDRSKLAGQGSTLELSSGMFTVFFPHDAHRPCMQANKSSPVRKIVLKVMVK